MPPASQCVGRGDAPSDAWLLCAICGPVAEAQAREAGISFRDERGLLCEHRCYEVLEPVSLLSLQSWLEGNVRVKEAVDKLESLRLRSFGGRKRQVPLSHAELAGSARAALLCGKNRAFLRCYQKYVEARPYEWHPDIEHYRFWDRVLGPGWSGSDWVPAGTARNEIVLLTSCWFAFSALPLNSAQGRGASGAPEGEELLEVAAALRKADTRVLSHLAKKGGLPSLAGRALVAGEWALAQKYFEELFGRAAENRYALAQRHAMPLLVYALVGRVLAGGRQCYLQAWLGYVRSMVQQASSWYIETAQEELMSLLDNLEVVDKLVNRNTTLLPQLHVRGPLSRLPFAMLFSYLPDYVRSQFPVGEMLESLLALSRDGLRLLAALGAVGLNQAASLTPEQRASLEPLVAGVEWYAPPGGDSVPSTRRALAAVREVLAKQNPPGAFCQCRPDEKTPRLAVSRIGQGMLIHLDEREKDFGEKAASLLRCLQKYASRGCLVLEGGDPAELTRLCGEMQAVVEIGGSLALPSDTSAEAVPRVVMLLARLPDGGYAAALRVQLFPGAFPLLIPGSGVEDVVLERTGQARGTMLLHRDFVAERELIWQTLLLLKQGGVAEAMSLEGGAAHLDDLAALSALMQQCQRHQLQICWEPGMEFQLHQPQSGLRFRRGDAENGWLELGADLPVDEGRVLELDCLLRAYGQRKGDILQVGPEECVLLNSSLKQQLALLQLVWHEKHGRHGVSEAALYLLESLGNENAASPLEGGLATRPAAAALPPGFAATLRPYQQEGYRWLVERGRMRLGSILADDMGLGKTVQLLAFLLYAARREGAGASLVVAPVSLLSNWAEEAARFAPGLRLVFFLPGNEGLPGKLSAGDVVLVSYGQLVARQQLFSSREWDVLVLDEAQAIKNPESQRARAVCSLEARMRFCLTGTPIENRLLDLWSQMRFLNPGLLGGRAAFLKRFGRAGEEERALLRRAMAPLVLRRTKGDVLAQLPPLTEMIEWVEFSHEERALYESLRRSAVARLECGADEGSKGVGILAELTRLRRACCHGKLAFQAFAGESAKLRTLAALIGELREAGHRALVFSQFADVLELAECLLQQRGISCLRFDGSTPARHRAKLVKEFQAGTADAFLISLRAGGTGLNLTAADYVILLDPWWNPAVETQAAGRSHRMGQQRPVTLCRLIVRGSVEEYMLDLHCEKKELAESILSGCGEGVNPELLLTLLRAC